MILSDNEIKKLAIEKEMISPFEMKQKRENIISFGLSSYGYDFRIDNDFRIFQKNNSCIIDPKKFDENVYIQHVGNECIIPPNSFILGKSVEYFKMPRNVLGICVGKSTLARCFDENTPVLCKVDEYNCKNQYIEKSKTAIYLANKKIKDIKIGDEVLTYNGNTKQYEIEKVTNTFKREEKDIISLTFSNNINLKATKEHPFYVINKGWIEVKNLDVGDKVIHYDYINLHNIETITVVKKQSIVNKRHLVYNIETEKNHNYFANGILVHNCGLILNVTPIEPGWEGYITIEVSNSTPLPAKIYAYEGIAQLVFFKGKQCEISYADKKGKYQKQTGLTLPRI